MIKQINRAVQDFLRPKRLAFGRWFWDRKKNKNIDLNMDDVKKILFLRYDGKIGDMIINTLMFRELKRAYPHVEIGVVVRGANKQVIENNPNVNKIYEYDKNTKTIKNLTTEIAEENYDILIDFSEMLRVKQMMFINKCKARINIGLDKKDWNLFDISINPEEDFLWDEHITRRYAAYLKRLGIKSIDFSYDIYLDAEEEKKGMRLKEKIGENNKLIVINPYGASKHKTFSKEKIRELLEIFSKENGNYFSFIFPPNKKEEIVQLVNELQNERIVIDENIKTIRDSSGIIKHSDLLITPDTSVVHIGAAFDKKMIAVYPPKGGRFGVDHMVWSPSNIGENAKIIFCEDKNSSRDEIDINTFKISDLKAAL